MSFSEHKDYFIVTLMDGYLLRVSFCDFLLCYPSARFSGHGCTIRREVNHSFMEKSSSIVTDRIKETSQWVNNQVRDHKRFLEQGNQRSVTLSEHELVVRNFYKRKALSLEGVVGRV